MRLANPAPIVCLAIALAACGLESAPSTLDRALLKYSDPPAEGPWEVVRDTPEFWGDIEALYAAAEAGDPRALRVLLLVRQHTDGCISEWFPDVHALVR